MSPQMNATIAKQTDSIKELSGRISTLEDQLATDRVIMSIATTMTSKEGNALIDTLADDVARKIKGQQVAGPTAPGPHPTRK